MTLVVIKGKDATSTRTQIVAALKRCFNYDVKSDTPLDHANGRTETAETQTPFTDADWNDIFEPGTQQTADGPQEFALVIDGNSLKFALEKPCKKLLLELACRCSAVVCCRVSPLQKAQVVSLVKNGLNVMTLAIGDGANDVSMIHEANVGVGIQGLEGVQAAMASDYAIGQFRYLTRLVLVHGRWAYIRTAEMTLLMFYKNIAWTLCLFWFQQYCSFTAAMNFDYFFLLFFNLLYTSLPTIVLGTFDQDLDDRYSIAAPQVYKRGIRKEYYNITRFSLYVIEGFYQSLICYYVSHLLYNDSVVDWQGYSVDITGMGTLGALVAITAINVYAGLAAYSWTWVFHFAVWASILVFVCVILIYSFTPSSTLLGMTSRVLSLPSFWLAVVLAFVLCMLPRYLIKFAWSYLKPTDVDLLREIKKYHLDERALDPALEAQPSITGENGMEMKPIGRRSGSPGYGQLVTAAQRINSSVDRYIVDPLKRQFQNLRPQFQRTSPFLFMRTGKTRSNTGFAFSQEPGVAEHLPQLATPTEATMRRLQPGKFHSMTQLETLRGAPRPSTAPTRSLQNLESRRSFDGNSATRPPWWKPTLPGGAGPSRLPDGVMSAPVSPMRDMLPGNVPARTLTKAAETQTANSAGDENAPKDSTKL